jgi:hypothetical protein
MSSSTNDTVCSGSFTTTGATPASDTSILKVKTQEASLAMDVNVPTFPRPRRRKLVRYSTLEIRSYPLCLGDNPAVRGNLPLALDYSQPCETRLMGLEDYERQRGPRAKNQEGFRLSQFARTQVLDQAKVEPSHLRECTKKVRLVQQQRGWTNRIRSLEPIQEGWELIHKAVRNATWNRSQKQKERELLRRYRIPAPGRQEAI